jgi:hypothetical protein
MWGELLATWHGVLKESENETGWKSGMCVVKEVVLLASSSEHHNVIICLIRVA